MSAPNDSRSPKTRFHDNYGSERGVSTSIPRRSFQSSQSEIHSRAPGGHTRAFNRSNVPTTSEGQSDRPSSLDPIDSRDTHRDTRDTRDFRESYPRERVTYRDNRETRDFRENRHSETRSADTGFRDHTETREVYRRPRDEFREPGFREGRDSVKYGRDIQISSAGQPDYAAESSERPDIKQRKPDIISAGRVDSATKREYLDIPMPPRDSIRESRPFREDVREDRFSSAHQDIEGPPRDIVRVSSEPRHERRDFRTHEFSRGQEREFIPRSADSSRSGDIESYRPQTDKPTESRPQRNIEIVRAPVQGPPRDNIPRPIHSYNSSNTNMGERERFGERELPSSSSTQPPLKPHNSESSFRDYKAPHPEENRSFESRNEGRSGGLNFEQRTPKPFYSGRSFPISASARQDYSRGRHGGFEADRRYPRPGQPRLLDSNFTSPSAAPVSTSISSSMDITRPPISAVTAPTPTETPTSIIPDKTEIARTIEEKEDSIMDTANELEQLKKERDRLLRETAEINASPAGTLRSLVSGLSISQEVLTMSTDELVESTYIRNYQLAKRANEVSIAQLWDPTNRSKYAPYIAYLTSTSRQFSYLRAYLKQNQEVKSENHQMDVTSTDTKKSEDSTTTDKPISTNSSISPDPHFLPEVLQEKPAEYIEEDFFEPVEAPQPSDYSFYADNQVLHEQIKEMMVQQLKSQQEERILHIQKSIKAHAKATRAWYRRLNQEREEEATKRLLQNKKWLHVAQSGRKSSVRVKGDETSSIRSKRNEEEEEYDEERYEPNKADIPPMLEFDPQATDHTFAMIDHRGYVEDSRMIDHEIKVDRPWYPAEEDIFIQCFLRYHKNFVKIAHYLPGHSLAEVIWFYYTRKNKLDLKRRFIREGHRYLQDGTPQVPVTEQMAMHADTDLAFYFGSNVEWVNGTSRRGSLRIFEKVNKEDKPAKGKSSTSSSLEDPDVDIESSGTYSPAAIRSLHSSSSSVPYHETAVRWTQEERDKFKTAFDLHGKDFKSIADIMKTKNPAQCKNYYHNNRKRLLPSGDTTKDEASATGTALDSPRVVIDSPTHDPSRESLLSSRELSSSIELNASTEIEDSSKVRSLTSSTQVIPASPSADTEIGPPVTSGDSTVPKSGAKKGGYTPRGSSSHWTETEKTQFLELLAIHGKDWKAFTDTIRSKTMAQIKNFFQNYRIKLKLDDLLPSGDKSIIPTRGRTKKRKGGRRKKSTSTDQSDSSDVDDEEDEEDDNQDSGDESIHDELSTSINQGDFETKSTEEIAERPSPTENSTSNETSIDTAPTKESVQPSNTNTNTEKNEESSTNIEQSTDSTITDELPVPSTQKRKRENSDEDDDDLPSPKKMKLSE